MQNTSMHIVSAQEWFVEWINKWMNQEKTISDMEISEVPHCYELEAP